MSYKRKNQSIDRRAKYTQNVIQTSLLSLMQQKPFTKIMVTEICKYRKAGNFVFCFLMNRFCPAAE
ncbi:MAG TPA: hypothetical protein H9705_06340 [Candidatus Fusicatenibacter intestinigallinarum]|uniref:Uncharacterized protein n=1 Tax=Candidatus Fusicatenibacter intestinigallinarum TaxID=2838598 RepID=A0A9D2SLY4_9FIRM|nr:hypothetical protein [Candidatus Fusicatenibacter intestinigallinarum]